jgi:hypothetical protein
MYYLLASDSDNKVYIKTTEGYVNYNRNDIPSNAISFNEITKLEDNFIPFADNAFRYIKAYQYITKPLVNETYVPLIKRHNGDVYSYCIEKRSTTDGCITSLEAAKMELRNLLRIEKRNTDSWAKERKFSIEDETKAVESIRKEYRHNRLKYERFKHFDEQSIIHLAKGCLEYDQRTDRSFPTEDINT